MSCCLLAKGWVSEAEEAESRDDDSEVYFREKVWHS